MHIIVVSNRLATARTITVGPRQLVVAGAGLVGLVIAISAFFSMLALHHLPEIRLPFVQNILLSLRAEETQRTQAFVRENLNAMAVKLGEMQAQVLHLDTLGERLAQMAGIRPADSRTARKPGQGGPLVGPVERLTTEGLRQQLDDLSKRLEANGDQLGLIETELFDERVRQNLLPTALPVQGAWDSSSFGRRIDPFTGVVANHTGVDFTAETGTPIYAAAGGVVLAAEYHAQYGHMIDLDHGNELTTRYAHASRLFVAPGQVVRRGQKIAEVGSTGRSTGPHLHFEVRVKDLPKNPNRFLQMARDQQLASAGR